MKENNNLKKLKTDINSRRKHRDRFKNWPTVMFHTIEKKYPFVAKTRNGDRVTIHGVNELFLIMHGIRSLRYDESERVTHIIYNGRDVRFLGAEDNGDLPGVFLEKTINSWTLMMRLYWI